LSAEVAKFLAAKDAEFFKTSVAVAHTASELQQLIQLSQFRGKN
jgi:hypothetical protein